jgi:glycosyltransferase involved in cell wall biosynthesis
LGGSESSVCYLARELAAQNHAVFLISNDPSADRRHGVTHIPRTKLDAKLLQSLNLDALIALFAAGNGAALRNLAGPNLRLVFWTQHAADQPAVQALANPAERGAYNDFVMVSQWQAEQFQRQFAIDPRRTHVLRNAIAPAFANQFPPGTSILSHKPTPPILAYTSTPFRGLNWLLDAFPTIRAAVPGTRLKVFSSMKVYRTPAAQDAAQFGLLYERCRRTPGIEYVGSVPQAKLAGAMREVSALTYPNTFEETSCISVMEALASGCHVITSQLAALPETTAGFGDLIRLEGGRDAYLRQFVERTVHALRQRELQPIELETQLRRQVDFMNEQATSDGRAREWAAWLGSSVIQS